MVVLHTYAEVEYIAAEVLLRDGLVAAFMIVVAVGYLDFRAFEFLGEEATLDTDTQLAAEGLEFVAGLNVEIEIVEQSD